ncbi:hypothetical protein CALCODRAFT_523988 [Calocera cornea HHB12733]|uniref:Ketoreductase (KR) domain-containing protein n=1 Tax=Calocera cornea HHB12733 TaxID=1353952 RepID=A0A165FYP2_9BASI|nr:hypothetical protein CALCODRAFT_523988 [Calocera cornea HHB12733]
MPVPLFLVISRNLPSSAYLPLALAVTALVLLYAYSRGASNPRLRDMHARTVLLTGGLTPLGLTVLDSLAAQGAHIVLLEPTLHSPTAQLLLPALQEQHKNPSIHVAECDLSSARSVREFVGKFARTAPGAGREAARVDALVLCGGYGWRAEGIVGSKGALGGEGAQGEEEELGEFLLTTMLLPLLLRAPGTRDIRVVNVVNPFYAAAFPGFPSLVLPPTDPAGGEAGEEKGEAEREEAGEPAKGIEARGKTSSFQREGIRALRSIIWSVHLQRVLDALVPVATERGPQADPVGGAGGANADREGTGSKGVEGASTPRRRSNILSLSVCPGFSRADIASRYLGASGPSATVLGVLRYLILWPALFLLLKPPRAAAQTVLYALYAPASHLPSIPTTSLNRTTTTTTTSPATTSPNALPETAKLVGGTLYRELRPIVPPQPVGADWGGEAVGRGVWEGLESGVRVWEERAKAGGEGRGREGKERGLETVREESEPAEPAVAS